MIPLVWLLLIFTGCTYSVTMLNTAGEGEDIIEENQSANPEIKPDLSIPSI